MLNAARALAMTTFDLQQADILKSVRDEFIAWQSTVLQEK